jgi:zinc transporter 1/2/3
MPGLIAMLSVLTVVGIEMFFAMRGAGHVHGTDFDVFGGEDEAFEGRQRSGSVKRFRDADPRPPAIHLGPLQGASSENLMAGRSPSLGQPSPLPPPTPNPRRSTDSNASSEGDNLDLDELIQDQAPNAGLLNGTTKRSDHNDDHSDIDDGHLHDGHEHMTPSAQASHQKALLQCLLLEAGILFHSVFIGMAVSVSTGPPFAVLLVAICFHQTFEGLALGARIGALSFPQSSPKPWLMALAYGTTTPIGQAIGLAIHNLYDPQSATGLLTVGIMNAISSGLLLFAGMVELLAEDFLSDQSYKTLRGRRRYQACGAVVAGALLMALVGAWA